MENMQLEKQTFAKVMKADGTNNGAAAGTTTITTDVIDLAGVQGGVIFDYLLGTVTSTGTGSIQLQTSDASGSGFANEGTAVTYADTDSGKLIVIGLARPTKRYARLVNTRATANSVVTSLVARAYSLRYQPKTIDATVLSRNSFIAS